MLGVEGGEDFVLEGGAEGLQLGSQGQDLNVVRVGSGDLWVIGMKLAHEIGMKFWHKKISTRQNF